MPRPRPLLAAMLVATSALAHGAPATNALHAQQSRLTYFFGISPGEYTASADELAANAFATLELEQHVVTTATPPKPRFRDATAVAKVFPEGFTLTATFENARGETVTELSTPGFYGANLTATTQGGRAYGPIRRVLVRLPAGEKAGDDVSEAAALRLFAAEKLGHAWRMEADPSLFTYAMRFRWDVDKAAGRIKPLERFVILPPDYEAAKAAGKRFPLYIDLHGSGALRVDFEKFKADPYFDTFKPLAARGVVVIAPLSHQQWQAPAVLDVLDRAQAEFAVDPKHVYLGGHSMGGSGTWRVLDAAPERFAAAVPVSGGNVPPDIKARRFTGLPVWAVFGAKDNPDGQARTDALVKAINAAGGNARYTLLPDANHMQTRNRFFADPALWDWLLAQ